MARGSKMAVLLAMLAVIAGCALPSRQEPPHISVTSFSLVPGGNALAPKFNIGLRIVNPNRATLPLQGMAYDRTVDGNRILTGASPNLPRIPGYGTADIIVEASPDLVGGVRLLNDLLGGQRKSLDYSFHARLDVGRMLPHVEIEESGNLNLSGIRQ